VGRAAGEPCWDNVAAIRLKNVQPFNDCFVASKNLNAAILCFVMWRGKGRTCAPVAGNRHKTRLAPNSVVHGSADWRWRTGWNIARTLFFANRGRFRSGDYEEVMNKASSLSLLSNAVLVWKGYVENTCEKWLLGYRSRKA